MAAAGRRSRARRPLSIAVVRTAEGWYIQRGGEAFPVDAELPTTAALVTEGLGAVRAAASARAGGVPVDSLALLSPVTTPCRVVAQAVNYRSHARESGFGEDAPAVFCRKSSGSISGPTDGIARPGHVRLLDDELELGLVIRWTGAGRAGMPWDGGRAVDPAGAWVDTEA
jgi:2-keto-4-pentenoate hydratase/2-oxohepta-3-ene-1,7-dioic acid hydratase in catechol pathway